MTENTNEGFSYNSPERQKKSAYTALIIEIGVFIVAVLIILALLHYLGIINFVKFLPTPKETSIKTIDKTNYPNKPNFKPEKAVTAESKVEGYTLNIVNKEGLKELLDKWGVFEKALTDKNLKVSYISNLKIVLSPEVQPDYQVKTPNGPPYLGTKFTINGENGLLEVYIAPFILSDNKQNKNNFMISTAIRALYHLTHTTNDPQQYEANKEEVSRIAREMSKITYFAIEEQ